MAHLFNTTWLVKARLNEISKEIREIKLKSMEAKKIFGESEWRIAQIEDELK